MAERNQSNITRDALKQFTGSRDRLYGFLASRFTLDKAQVWDEFTGPTIDTNKWTVGNGGGASAASPAIDVGKQGGQIKFVTGTAGDNTAASTLAGGRHFTGDTNAIIVARLNINSAVTNVKVEVGFRDAITTTAGASQVVNSKSGNTFIATDGVCWIYDTSDTGRGWDGMGVANGTAATRMTSYNIVPVADTFEYLLVELVDGTAYFSHMTAAGLRDFGPVAMASAITKTVLVSPHVYVEARSATSRTVDVDMVAAWAARNTSP